MHILIIEDDIFFQKFYARKLIEKGFEVDTADDGEQGLALAKKIKPDIILLDIIMPKKDGFEVLENLSQEKDLKSVPVLVFSTLSQNDDVEKAKKLGARDFVNKSLLDFNVLLEKISSLNIT